MNLEDLKTHNGVSLQGLADYFLEQCAQAGCRGIFVIVKPPSEKDSPYAIVTNVGATAIPSALEGIVREMRIGLEENKVKEPS